MDIFYRMASVEYHMDRSLRQHGYPDYVWKGELTKYTNRLAERVVKSYKQGKAIDINDIKKISMPLERQFVVTIDNYREKHLTKLPKIELTEICGGDWVGLFKVRTLPRSGSVRLIRDFFFTLCEKANINPYSEKCDMWTDVGAGTELPQGTYRYHVKWSRDEEECGKRDFLRRSKADDIAETMTIRKSERTCTR